jgi:hypothetical protein
MKNKNIIDIINVILNKIPKHIQKREIKCIKKIEELKLIYEYIRDNSFDNLIDIETDIYYDLCNCIGNYLMKYKDKYWFNDELLKTIIMQYKIIQNNSLCKNKYRGRITKFCPFKNILIIRLLNGKMKSYL